MDEQLTPGGVSEAPSVEDVHDQASLDAAIAASQADMDPEDGSGDAVAESEEDGDGDELESEDEEPDDEPEPKAQKQSSFTEEDWDNWVEAAAQSLEGPDLWGKIPKQMQYRVAAALDAQLGGRDARNAYKAWKGKLSYTPEDVEAEAQRRAEQARQEAFQQAQYMAQQSQTANQVWERFAALDPEVNQDLAPDDRYDLFEASEADRAGFAYYQQLKQNYAAQYDPQAQLQQQVALGQQQVLMNVYQQLRSIPEVQALGATLDRDFALDKFEASESGYAQMLVAIALEAGKAQGRKEAAKVYSEKMPEQIAAAAREAKAQYRASLPKADGTGGSVSGFTSAQLNSPEFWADLAGKSEAERKAAERAYDQAGLSTPLRGR